MSPTVPAPLMDIELRGHYKARMSVSRDSEVGLPQICMASKGKSEGHMFMHGDSTEYEKRESSTCIRTP